MESYRENCIIAGMILKSWAFGGWMDGRSRKLELGRKQMPAGLTGLCRQLDLSLERAIFRSFSHHLLIHSPINFSIFSTEFALLEVLKSCVKNKAHSRVSNNEFNV